MIETGENSAKGKSGHQPSLALVRLSTRTMETGWKPVPECRGTSPESTVMPVAPCRARKPQGPGSGRGRCVRESPIMKLEDLILESQIAELRRLQSECLEARDTVQRVRSQLADLNTQAAEATASIQTQHEIETHRKVEQVSAEVRNRLEQSELDIAVQREAASESRERRLAELQARLKDDVAECRSKLQNELWVLQSVCDESNEDTPVRNVERSQEIVNTQQAFIDQQLSDVDERTQSLSRYLQACHAAMESILPPANVELKGRESSRVTAVEQADLALAAAGALHRQSLPQWIIGWRLYGLSLLVFVVVAIGATAVRADLTKYVNPEFSKPDWEWLGVSSLIGLGVAVLVGTTLFMIAQSRLREAFGEVLQHASNAKAAAQFWKKKSRQELRRLTENAEAWKEDMLRRREQHSAKLQSATDEKVNDLIHRYTEQMSAQSKRFDEQMLAGEAELARQQTAAENWRSLELTRIETQQKAELQRSRDQFLQETSARREQLAADESTALSRWKTAVTASRELVQVSQDRARGIPEFSELRSSGWTVPATLPGTLPVGDLRVDIPAVPDLANDSLDGKASFELPGLLRFPRDTSILVEHDAAGREPALAFVRAILLRLLTTIAPGRVQFTLIDPVGLGQSFSALMHLADFDELLISNRIWTESIQLRDRLQKVTEHMESVFQTYLRSEFETIEDYNAAAGEVAEPYHFVVVAGFPHSFTEEAARSLTSILTSGPRCGVHAIITWSPDQPVPRSFDISNLRNCCTQFHVADGAVQPGMSASDSLAVKAVRPAKGDFLSAGPAATAATNEVASVKFTALAPPDSASYVSLVRAVGEKSRNARRVEVSFSRIAPKPDAIWSFSSAEGIDFPIGRAGAARLQFMRLGRGTSQHVLVAGKTGSGKSTLLHILITNLAMHYSPDEIQFYLIDFKKGVEFRTYAANKLPHARVIAIESDREFGLSVLERLDEVLQERGELFRVRGVQDVPSFRKQFPDENMPRLLLLIDEFQEFFTSEDRVSSKAALLMDRLIRQGRAFGIHVLLGSQTLGGAYSLARSTMGQVAVRIALQCSESDAHLILSEENSAARLLTRPGEAIYNDANGMVEGNHPFQIAWLDEEKRESMIHEMIRRPDYLKRAPGRMIVFEGNVAPKVEECGPLNARIRTQCGAQADSDGVPAWIGEPVAIADPVCIRFQHSGGQNVLMVGQEGDMADAILASIVLSLCSGGDKSQSHRLPRMVFLHDGRDQASLTNFRDTFTKPIAPRLSLPDASDADTVVADLWNEMTERESGGVAKDAPDLVLVVRNIGQFRTLRRDEDDFGMSGFGAAKAVSPASQFGDLIRKGPLVGIHVIVWADTFGNAMRWLSNSLLREFDSRIAFRLNQTDSSSLIDNPSAAMLSPGRAILYRDQTGASDRFRPFSWPTDEWLVTLPSMPLEEEFHSPASVVDEQTAEPNPDIAVAKVRDAEVRDATAPVTAGTPVAETPAADSLSAEVSATATPAQPAEPPTKQESDKPNAEGSSEVVDEFDEMDFDSLMIE